MFCGRCGVHSPDDNSFCTQCGAPIASVPPNPYPHGGVHGGWKDTPPSPPPQSKFVNPQGYATPPYAYVDQPVPATKPAPPAYGTAGPIPPEMHWALVLLLGFVTFGIFYWVWMFKEAGFVKKIDRSSKAPVLLGVFLALYLVFIGGYVVLVSAAFITGATTNAQPGVESSEQFQASGNSDAAAVATTIVAFASLLVFACALAKAVIYLVLIFSMRNSINLYYTTIEPIGLRLNGVMTFFFSFLYFQYHFSRIAEWKRTGLFAKV